MFEITYGGSNSIDGSTIAPNTCAEDTSVAIQVKNTAAAANVSAFITDWSIVTRPLPIPVQNIFAVEKSEDFPVMVSRESGNVEDVFTVAMSAIIGECQEGARYGILSLTLSSSYLSGDGAGTVDNVAVTDSYSTGVCELTTTITAVNEPFGGHVCLSEHARLYDYGEY
jgi:hypothetical protein